MVNGCIVSGATVGGCERCDGVTSHDVGVNTSEVWHQLGNYAVTTHAHDMHRYHMTHMSLECHEDEIRAYGLVFIVHIYLII